MRKLLVAAALVIGVAIGSNLDCLYLYADQDSSSLAIQWVCGIQPRDPPVTTAIEPTTTVKPEPTAESSPTARPKALPAIIIIRNGSRSRINISIRELRELAGRLNLRDITIIYTLQYRYVDPDNLSESEIDGRMKCVLATCNVTVYWNRLPEGYEWTLMKCGDKYTSELGYMDCTAAHEFRHIWQQLYGHPNSELDAERFAEEWLEETDIHTW